MKYWRKKVLLAKIEATYGTDALPAAANAIEAQDVQLRPMEGQDVDRALERPYFGSSGTIPVDLHMVLTFKVQLAGSGAAGTAPAWGVLLRGCAMAETITPGQDAVYNPVSDGIESLTFYLNIDGVLFKLRGGRGTLEVDVNASGIPEASFTFTGVFTKASDQAAPTPDYTAWQVPEAASSANTPVFTLNGQARVMRSFKLNVANTVSPRFLIGRDSIEITDRQALVECQVEGTNIAGFDPFQLALDRSSVAVALTHGTQAGQRVAIAVPAAQMQRPGQAANGDGVVEWPLRLSAKPVAGNDDFTITVS